MKLGHDQFGGCTLIDRQLTFYHNYKIKNPHKRPYHRRYYELNNIKSTDIKVTKKECEKYILGNKDWIYVYNYLESLFKDGMTFENYGVDKINDREVYIIENIKQNKKGEVKLKKHIWIDKKDFFIHKAIYINRKDKLIKEINLSDLLFINGKPILSKINVQDFKKNKNISIVFKDISFNKITDFDMFVPKSIK